MRVREVNVKNFRNLVDLTVPIDDLTVLIGENNSGKTAFLEALRIVLSGSRGGTPFNEYDYHMSKPADSPQSSEGIVVEVWFREDKPKQWPQELIQALTKIIQTDPIKNLYSIGVRLSGKYDTTAKTFSSEWKFLAINGQTLDKQSVEQSNWRDLFSYIKLFYLSALRDANNEFSPRSQYWSKILRDLKISEEQRARFTEELSKLNEELLKADPRLEQVCASLDKVQEIMESGIGQRTSIQALPLRPWDLMVKSEIVVKPRGGEVEFPLSRHGQGMQSLSVLFLLEAYIDLLLKSSFKSETEAILALEEPEAHLHPQATRALAANLSENQAQKIVSSHSPYFIQEIPFANIRMFRRKGPTSSVLYAKRSFSINLPNIAEIVTFCQRNSPKFDYNQSTLILTVNGKIDQNEYRDLLTIYSSQGDVHPELKRLYDESQLYLSEKVLADLNTCAKRIRGEVLFARAWLLCEGQSDYLLIRYFDELLGGLLDKKGITIVDFQNGGSPSSFVGLARVFEIPWYMIYDNDTEGKVFIKQIKDLGLKDEEILSCVQSMPEEGMDLELFLAKNGFAQEYATILRNQGKVLSKQNGEAGFENELAEIIRKDKTGNTIALIDMLRLANVDQTRVPEFFKEAIKKTVEKTK